jgi:hypothetical protein
MGFKTILVPIEQHDLVNSTLETALLLARKFDSYIEGFALRVEIPVVFAVGDVGAVPIPAFEQDIAENEKRSRSLFENFMQEHGVPRGGDAKALSSGWLDNAPQGDLFVGSYGRVFDVTFLGKPGRDPKGPRITTLEAGLFESGRPVLIAPPVVRPQMGTILSRVLPPAQRAGQPRLRRMGAACRASSASASSTCSPQLAACRFPRSSSSRRRTR